MWQESTGSSCTSQPCVSVQQTPISPADGASRAGKKDSWLTDFALLSFRTNRCRTKLDPSNQARDPRNGQVLFSVPASLRSQATVAKNRERSLEYNDDSRKHWSDL